MIAYILRGHTRMYCFYFFFTGRCGPINGGLISWGTYKLNNNKNKNKAAVLYGIILSWCRIPPFFKSSTKCEI